jgi:Zn-dependent peptidase ImmA (M78 family)
VRRVLRARQKATELLARSPMKDTWVDVFSLASNLPEVAAVRAIDLSEDISGALVPVSEGKWVILVNQDHAPARQRFSVAHELGHLFLHQYRVPHADRTLKLRDAQSSEGSAFEEIEANQFAAELLMPRALLLKALRGHVIEYEPESSARAADFTKLVKALAKRFKVSDQAMTIRLSSLYSG